jgi:hypothetical protein
MESTGLGMWDIRCRLRPKLCRLDPEAVQREVAKVVKRHGPRGEGWQWIGDDDAWNGMQLGPALAHEPLVDGRLQSVAVRLRQAVDGAALPPLDDLSGDDPGQRGGTRALASRVINGAKGLRQVGDGCHALSREAGRGMVGEVG